MKVKPRINNLLYVKDVGAFKVATIMLDPHQVWERRDKSANDIMLLRDNVTIRVDYATYKKYFREVKEWV